jgi:hypothetical protein
MPIYRKIWIKHNGPIPIDEYGRPYEIHHIDGNRKNNNISNLICVSIQEHYNIHLSQGDYGACRAIVNRMNKDPKLLSELAREWAFERVAAGTHNLQGPEHNRKLLEMGIHPFLHVDRKKQALTRVKNGTHPFFNPEIGRMHAEHMLTCPHCGKTGHGNIMMRWHFDNCKTKKV